MIATQVNRTSKGFTAIELLITLFIAAFALAAGYQLYSAVIKQDSETRAEARVGNFALEQVRRNTGSATAPCSPQPPASQSDNLDTIGTVNTVITVTCPNMNVTNLTKITATVTYGNPVKTVVRSTYITPEGV